MNILIDRHHEALYSSLIRLFEGRLSYNCFCQLGMEWWQEGYWNIFPAEATARQYLSLDQGYLPEDGTHALNQLIKGIDTPFDWYLIKDPQTGRPMKGITLDEFKKQKFDILIASIPQHVELFLKLAKLYQPQAKLIFQVGNAWNFDTSFPIKNILASAKIPQLAGFNQIEYHQEFDTSLFSFTPVKPTRKIYSFINCLGSADLFTKDWALFLKLEKLMPDYEFKSFGGQCRDGYCSGAKEVADKMQEAEWIYMVKNQGDGYGHNIFGAGSVGRPLITRRSDYQGKLAECLIGDGLSTAVTVDGRTPKEIADLIRLADSKQTGQNIREQFVKNVDFEKEAKLIREFLNRLI